jgi:hypothetical protein
VRIRRTKLKGDFVQIPNGTVRDGRLSHMARGILAELLSRPDGWETTADDMWRASVAIHGTNSPGRRVFRAAFAELKEQCYLTSGREPLGGGRYGTVLTLTDVPHAGTSARPGDSSIPTGGTDVPHAGTPDASTDVPPAGTPERPAETGISAGRTDVPLSDVPHAGTSKEENGETNTGLKTSSSTGLASRDDEDDLFRFLAADSDATHSQSQTEDLSEFGNFWLVYPKSRDKQATLAAWKAVVAKGVDPQRLTAAAVAYAHERRGEDLRFTKYSANWLRDARYEDVIDPDQPPASKAAAGGYQPYRNPVNQDDYDQPFWSD